MPLTVYLVRHGQTEWNELGRIQGQTNVGLSEAGRQEVAELARYLGDEQFDAVLTSDLRRAVETASQLVELGPGTSSPIQRVPELRELDFGDWEGKTLAEVRSTDPVNWRQWMKNPFQHAPPGGETLAQLAERTERVIAALKDFKGDRVLIVTHQTPLQVMLCQLLDFNLRHYWRLVVDTGSLSIVQLYGDLAAMRLFNFRATHFNGQPLSEP